MYDTVVFLVFSFIKQFQINLLKNTKIYPSDFMSITRTFIPFTQCVC